MILTRSIARTTLPVAALALAFTLGGAHAARAAAPGTYVDASDDAKSAPDIRKVSVTDNGDGTLSVAIDLPPDEALTGDATVSVVIDADRKRSTGSSLGGEFIFSTGAERAGLGRWDGSAWQPFEHRPTNPDFTAGRVSFTLTLADLGTTAFDFIVLGYRGSDVDAAPESGAFTWPQAEQRLEIQSIVVPAQALFPKIGRRYALGPVKLKLATSEIVPADSVDCSLTYGATRIPSAGTCVWVLPRTYSKKHLKLTVRADFKGVTSSLSLPVTPR